MKNKFRLLVFLSFVSVEFTNAQIANVPLEDVQKYAATITSQELRSHLTILASDEFEGRETGKKGQKMAAEYIAKIFQAHSIEEQKEGGYFQKFSVMESKIGKMELKINNTSYAFAKDYYLVQDFNSQKLSNNKILFAGFGISDTNYNDLEKLEVKDKVLMIMRGEPKNKKGIFRISGTSQASENYVRDSYKIEKLTALKPKILLIVDPKIDSNMKRYKRYFSEPSMKLEKDLETPNMTVVYISTKMAAELLSLSNKKFNSMVAKMNENGKPQTKSTTNTITYNFTKNRQNIETENVLGFIEGTKFPEEILVISAHYDHLGIIDGKVYNGADDDGTGTSAILEISEAFAKAKKDGKGPKRSILFLAVSGEEKGLLGSDYYTTNPVYPLENTIADLNIDMIGRVDEPHSTDAGQNYIYLIGSDKLSSELHSISEMSNKKYGKMDLDYTFNDPSDPNQFYYRSDHYNFAKNNIPVIFYFNGVHEDYHKETDEISKINFDLLNKRTQLVFYTAWELVNRGSRIRVDLVNDFNEK